MTQNQGDVAAQIKLTDAQFCLLLHKNSRLDKKTGGLCVRLVIYRWLLLLLF